MHQQTIIVVLIGLAVSAYGLDLSHADQSSKKLDSQTVRLISNLYAQMISKPINNLFTNLAVLGTHLLGDISQNGIHTADGRTLHPSDEQLRGFFGGLWNDALKPPIENALQGISLMLAQVLAGVGTEGINLGIGKRDLTEAELRGFFGGLWNDALKPPIENALQGISLMLAQVLAGVGTEGISLGIGKRDLAEAELRGFFDSLGQAVNDVFSNVIQKPLEDALAGGALLLAQALAGMGTNGINLSGLFGKRDVMDLSGHEAELRGIFGTVSGAVVNGLTGVWNNVFQVPLENLVQNTALTTAAWLAILGTEGVNLGKRNTVDFSGREDELRGILSTVGNGLAAVWNNVFQSPLENFVQNTAFNLAVNLANFAENGFGGR